MDKTQCQMVTIELDYTMSNYYFFNFKTFHYFISALMIPNALIDSLGKSELQLFKPNKPP